MFGRKCQFHVKQRPERLQSAPQLPFNILDAKMSNPGLLQVDASPMTLLCMSKIAWIRPQTSPSRDAHMSEAAECSRCSGLMKTSAKES